MSKSLIQTVNQSSQVVAANSIIDLGSVIRRFGCNLRLNGNAIEVDGVGAVLLEGEAQNEDVTVEHLDAFLQHQLDSLGGHILTHAVIHAATGKDDFRIVAVTLGALG